MSQNKKSAKAPSAYSNHFEAMKTLAKCRLIPGTCKLGDRPRISPTPALDLFFPTLIDRSPCV